MTEFCVKPIGYIENNYTDKFGIPRQSNLVKSSVSTIIFHEEFRDENALRGLEGYSHIWLLWMFDKADTTKGFSPTVRPPRLGGNTRMGVFATRSPYHPNRIGLSCVRLLSIEKTHDKGTVLKVSGDDLLCGTPIIDIKPYLPFSDSYPDARGGFADEFFGERLEVKFGDDAECLSDETKAQLCEILSQDPRPAYQNDESRIYKMDYGMYKISFSVKGNVLYVLTAEKSETEFDL